MVTCGVDKTIRVWNYLTLDMELSREFEETVHSVALHPSGLNILAGFSDRVRLMNLLIDDIRTFREFPMKCANVCSFSNGGHLLAATSDRDILVYSSIHFNKMVNSNFRRLVIFANRETDTGLIFRRTYAGTTARSQPCLGPSRTVPSSPVPTTGLSTSGTSLTTAPGSRNS